MLKRKRTYSNQNKLLAAAVLTTLLGMTGTGHAFEKKPVYVEYQGRPMVEMQLFTEGEALEEIVDEAGYTLDASLFKATQDGTSYWTDMLGPRAKNGQPWQIFVTTEAGEQNAAAASRGMVVDEGEPAITDENLVAQLLQDGKPLTRLTESVAALDTPPDGAYGFSMISIGQFLGAKREKAVDGWWVDADTVLPTNEQAADFVGTIRHELGHALGIAIATEYIDETGDAIDPEDESEIVHSKVTGEELVRFAEDVTDERSWNAHLVDQYGNAAKPEMEILSQAGFAAKQQQDSSAKRKDYFIVNNLTKGEDGKGANGRAFFVGKHVTDALAGKTFFGVSGIPVNTWEEDEFEGSHLQTTGMMSHRAYSNYTSFMELELAVMQDLGYDIDRKAYFGYSVYGDGQTITNTQGYFARNAAGTDYVEGRVSAVPLGVGLHIYGSRNKVTQAADVLTTGSGATGVRVDGLQNTLTIPASTRIQADGVQGNGILIAYGRDQVVNQAGTVTANGKGGTGIRFDFGSSTNGAMDEYRGSYIRYQRVVEEETGNIFSSRNLKLTDMDASVYNAAADELNGAMVKDYTLTGTLAGAENAMYIGKNAFVKNIHVQNGATIKGNITSDWKHFKTDGSYDGVSKSRTEWDPQLGDWLAEHYPEIDMLDLLDWPAAEQAPYLEAWKATAEAREVTSTTPALKLQFGGKTGEDGYAYDAYIPDLVTNLNFQATMVYDGNITGADNMKLHVKGGTLRYGGTADVVGVTVAKGATLLGGSYKVHDMSGQVAANFASKLDDTDKGNFVSHGTIGAVGKDASMNITGNLISDGTLQAFAGGSAGDIRVSGEANIHGSDVRVLNALPDERVTVLTASMINGDTKTPVGSQYALSAMMNGKNEVDGGGLSVTTEAADNLDGADAAQRETYGAIVAMNSALQRSGDPRRSELRGLFQMDSGAAKKALTAISSHAPAESMAVAQRSTLTQHMLRSRLTEAFTWQNAQVRVPVQQLTEIKGGETRTLTLDVKRVEPTDNNLWMKFGKNWGEVRAGADYHSSTTLFGWDRAYDGNWRAGAFVGYCKTGFADSTASNDLRDTRVGVYGGYSKGQTEGMVYLNYGWLRNDLRRGIPPLGLTTHANYHSRLLELGGEYLYDLHAATDSPWHVRPYVNAQLSRLWQNAYSESGAGVLGQAVRSKQNDYLSAGTGVEFKRYLAGGNYAIRAGVQHAFSGAEPSLRYSYLGDRANSYNMRNVQDKTHFLLSIGGETEIAKNWGIGGDAGIQRGRHDKDWSCAVMLKYIW